MMFARVYRFMFYTVRKSYQLGLRLTGETISMWLPRVDLTLEVSMSDVDLDTHISRLSVVSVD
jgi:hypothetical protein